MSAQNVPYVTALQQIADLDARLQYERCPEAYFHDCERLCKPTKRCKLLPQSEIGRIAVAALEAK